MIDRQGRPVFIVGPEGQLEGAWHHMGSELNAIVCHPHPLHQGSMHNKVVMATTWALLEQGYNVLRFNYRSVGQSHGRYGHIEGEVLDASAAAHWVKQETGNDVALWAGFSFGSYIAARQVQVSPVKLIMIAPPVERMSFDELMIPDQSLVMMCKDDEVVRYEAVNEYLSSHYKNDQIILREGGHFFHGRTLHLRKYIETWLNNL
jgi:alpha/beta superfamily hydrolase